MSRVTVHTGARLHLGLLDTVAPFGGLGVMVDQPQTIISVEPHNDFFAGPSVTRRATAIAQRCKQFTGQAEALQVSVRASESAPAHCGFGSGTQASLAIAEGICKLIGAAIDHETLAREIADRGKRSAVGVHGYFQGGLIYETSDGANGGLNCVRERIELPSEWRVVLVRSRGLSATFGEDERQQFLKLPRPNEATRNSLRRNIEAEILPAARQADFESFAVAVERYNHDSGLMFAPVQGGPYNGTAVAQAVQLLKSLGACSVGQTSWGPCVFAWLPSDEVARSLVERIDPNELLTQIVRPLNRGRELRLENEL